MLHELLLVLREALHGYPISPAHCLGDSAGEPFLWQRRAKPDKRDAEARAELHGGAADEVDLECEGLLKREAGTKNEELPHD